MKISPTGNIKSSDLSNYNNNENNQNSLFNLKEHKQEENKVLNPFTNQPMDPNQFHSGQNPLNEESQIINSILNDNNVPLNVKKKHWWVFSRDNSMTFLDEKRKKEKLLSFDIIKIDTLNELPYYDYNFEVEKEFNVLRNVFDMKLDRSLGTTKTNQINERIAQKSQFNEHRQISKDENANQSAGFISKLINRGR